MSGHVRAGRGTGHRSLCSGCFPLTCWARKWASLRSQGVRMTHRGDHGAYIKNGLFSGKIACVGFCVIHFLGKCFTDYFGPNGILACVGKLIIFGENDILRKNAYFFICMHVGGINAFLFLRILFFGLYLPAVPFCGNADFDVDEEEEEGEPEETAPPEE